MRALLVINPQATGVSRAVTSIVTRALQAELEIDLVETDARGHGVAIAAQAANYELIIACGGDGTVNEVVNGMFATKARLGVIPAGSTNVFARTLGYRNDAVEATYQLLQAEAANSTRKINLGRAEWQSSEGEQFNRLFTFGAGFGFDGEVVRAVDWSRRQGETSSVSLYWRSVLRKIAKQINTANPHPLFYVEEALPLGVALISNTDPYTYLHQRAIHPTPRSNYESGLDLMALTTLSIPLLLQTMMVLSSGKTPRGKNIIHRHDLDCLTLQSKSPLAVQVDGEPLGRSLEVKFSAERSGLTVTSPLR